MWHLYKSLYRKKYAKLALKQKVSVVDAMVHKTLTSVDAIEAYSSIWQVEPNKRYDIMKKAAEYSLNKPWKCDELKKIYLMKTERAPTRQDSTKGKDGPAGSHSCNNHLRAVAPKPLRFYLMRFWDNFGTVAK